MSDVIFVNDSVKILARRVEWENSIDLLIVEKREQSTSYVTEMVMSQLAAGQSIRRPSLRISVEAAQKLMDELWQTGLRPTEGTGSAGAMAAVERHLKDMQRLVFDKGASDGR